MRDTKKALFSILILLSIILQPFLAIIPQVQAEINIDLWVDSFTGEFVAWDTEQGASPYLNNDDTNWIHEEKDNGVNEGCFGFEDTELSGIINNVNLYIECYGDGNNDQIEVYVDSNDGNNYDLEGTITVDQLSYAYELLVCSSLDSWAEINFASMRLKYIKKKGGGGDDVYVRRAYLTVDYTEPPPPPPPPPGGNPGEGDYIDSWDISSESGDALSLTTDGINIWVIDYVDTEVYKYTMAGVYVDHWDISGQSSDGYGITTDGSNIWVSDFGDTEVYKYTMAGVYVDSWDTSGQSTYLYGVATDGNFIWLVDWLAREVYKYSMAGVYTDEHWDVSVQTLDSCDITTDGNHIWVVSPDDAEVYKYHMNGTYILSWDTSVQSDDGYGITTDGTNIWIVDHVDDEVYKYEGPAPPTPTPPDPINLFGAGFNASSPYVDLIWTHNLTDTDFFEIQNSSDGLSWDYLGQNTTTQYTDFQVFNGTERYYKVRACNYEVVGGWANSSFSDVNFETVHFLAVIGDDGVAVNVPAIIAITFNTTLAGDGCSVYASFSDEEGLDGYIFWNNATSAPGGVNSTFTGLAGVSDSTHEDVTLPSSGTKFGVKYYVNDTDGNWGVDTLVIYPTLIPESVNIFTGSSGIFGMILCILVPIVAYVVKKG